MMMMMNDSYYKFQRSDAERFASVVAKGKSMMRGDELVFKYCPYCIGGDHNDKNTFSINLNTGQYECKRSSCSARGNMISLAKDFHDRGFYLSDDVDTYYNISGRKTKFKQFADAHKSIEVRTGAIEYLAERGIPEEITRKYEVTLMPKRKNVLVFPFRNENGAICFVKYRNISNDRTGPKEWCVSGNFEKILFGMNHCEDFGTLVITEGQIDSLSLAAAGVKNAVSVPTGKNGFTWKPNVWNWLVKFDEIVVFGDLENGEVTMAREISSFFRKRVRIVQNEDYCGCKDANEILQKEGCGPEALRKAIDNAKVRVSFRIRNLADVESVDLNKQVAYPTYIEQLDKAIGRGFHDGELIILTGKCGEGKSTFASQIVARMIQNGLKCFCYSGELQDFMFRAWIDRQIIGHDNLKEFERLNAGNWYNGKCYLYDNSSVIDEKEELFDLMEQAVRDLQCKFFLVDNLMTAMEDKPKEDIFRQQSNFVGRLTRFAKGFNVVIMLIAHPRKGSSDDNDSISGSGDITNRANLVLRFQRKSDKPSDENVSLLKITKNRTTGKLNTHGFDLEYDPKSMRISESGKTFYPFIVDDDGFSDATEEETEYFRWEEGDQNWVMI